MKRILKVLVNTFALIMLLVSMSTMFACNKYTTKATVIVDINGEEKTIVMNLNSNLAPKTVEQVKSLIESKFYEGAIFYTNTTFSKQIMFGDLKMVDGNIEQIKTAEGKLPSEVIGEFANGARTGSTVNNVDGSVGLWRTWVGTTSTNYKYSTGNNTGRSTIYLPTDSISDYDGYFCIFAELDLEDDTTSANWTAIKEAVKTSIEDNYETFIIYYTKSESDAEPIFHCVKSSNYSKPSDLYEPDKNDYYGYTKCTIKVPVVDKDATVKSGVSIKSIVIG